MTEQAKQIEEIKGERDARLFNHYVSRYGYDLACKQRNGYRELYLTALKRIEELEGQGSRFKRSPYSIYSLVAKWFHFRGGTND